MAQGIITKALSGFYYIYDGTEIVTCRARGKFRHRGESPLVGDRVEFTPLDGGTGAVDAILPAGTLSGAPKLRACEIINELENNKRGIYGGAIGYVSFTGNLDTCIAIRLAFTKNGKVFVRSGAGIVADSVPENEYRECLQKAAAVRNAIQTAQEEIEV